MSHQEDALDENQQKFLSFNEGDERLQDETRIKEYVWGKRFTKEEDEILKDAIWAYIRSRGWDEDEGLRFILNCSKYKQARKCWEEIRNCLPYRPRKVIRHRAHVLMEEGTHLGHWSKEEAESLKRLEEEHGHSWRKISILLGRGRPNIKEKWRALKRSKATGIWTQAELQKLCNLVHECLQSKATLGNMGKENDHRILRDDINWEKIADDIGTHGHGSCCAQWYYTLASPMIASGEWANGDDFILLQRLLESGACAEEEVEWDCLLDHRSGQACLTRWQHMIQHLGGNRTRQFLEKLDLLAHRYAPGLLESSPGEGVTKTISQIVPK